MSNRREYIDYDYIDKLDAEQKDYLNQFTKEHHIASFKKDPEKRISKDTKLSYDANNARNRCMLSKARSTGLLDDSPTQQYLDSKVDEQATPYTAKTEDFLVNSIGYINNADNEYTLTELKMYLDGIINRLLGSK